MSKLSQSSQIVDNVVVCINHILNSSLFNEFDNDFTDNIEDYLLQAIDAEKVSKKVSLLKKAISELEKMNRKCKDERINDVIESVNFLNIILENEAEFPIAFFTNKFPFTIMGVSKKDDSDYYPSESDYSDEEDSEEESDDEESEDSESDDEEEEIDLDDKPLNYSLSRDSLMALISVLCKLPSAKVLSLYFDDELVSVEEFLSEAVSDFVLDYDTKNEEAMYYLDEDLERVIELLNGIYEDVPETHEEQIFLIRDRLIWARIMLEMEESDFLKELKVFHIKGIKLNKN
jgi:hypothetical protein